LITSANAALTVAAHPHFAHLRGVPVFAVGRRSAQATRAAGFTDVTSADGNVDDLLRLIAARAKPEAPLLYLAGEERSGDLAAGLGGQGHRVVTTVVYRAVAVASLPPAAAAALAGEIAGVLHFSRRSAEAYVNAALAAGLLASALKPAHFCLSAAVAEPLARAGAARIRVAARPVEAALIELIGGA
jgi:uroporphyrinogen-III synthase